MIRPWPVHERKQLLETTIFKLHTHGSTSPRTGSRHEFVVLEAPDWVNVIPLTVEGEVVMVRQFRQGRGEVTLEIPGGMVDPDDPDPEHAARRELLEETGYFPRRLEPLGVVAPNPAIQSNLCHSFLARDLELRGAPQLDSTEEIEVCRVPLVEIAQMIRDRRIDHALVVAAFWHLRASGLVPSWGA